MVRPNEEIPSLEELRRECQDAHVFLPEQARRHCCDHLLVRIHRQTQGHRHIAPEPGRRRPDRGELSRDESDRSDCRCALAEFRPRPEPALADPLYGIVALPARSDFSSRSCFGCSPRKRITALPLMPVIISRMFDPQLPGPDADLDFSALRYVSTTGGPVTARMLDQLQKTFPGTDIVLMYGLTEAFRSSWLPPDQLAARPTSIGKAIPEVELYVLDEQGRDCAPGVPGQLVHRGGCVAKGYWNAPEATAERFRQIDRFPGETVVFSGDLVRRDEEGLPLLPRREWTR